MPDATVSGAVCSCSIGEVLATQGVYADTAQGTSMLPLIRAGLDTIVVTPCSSSDLKPMDVVLFEREAAEKDKVYVLHRVVAREGVSVLAAGDNCPWAEWVSPAQVRGVLTGLYRPNGQTNVLETGRYGAYVALWCRPWRLRFALLAAVRRLRHGAAVVLVRLGLR